MSYKRLLIIFLTIYLLVSLPDILGVGFVVIDWVPEASFFQKITGSVINGITENYIYKLAIAFAVTLFVFVIRRFR
ncbi:hypothetical protein [Neobacillus sp. D3-1R]|uniref:hypothetical protein n=1 Tax=Neobacillus sp. D3-1R TaxID=3445778 RepID=UPI003FA00709